MNATIYKHEFNMRLRSVIIWSLSILLLIVFFFSIFPSFSEQAALLNDMLAKFPPQLLAAFGMGNMDLSNILAYFGFLVVFVQLCLAIQAGNYGFGMVSVEENELTADFLLTKPVSRMQIMNSKLLAVISSLLVTDLVIWVGSLVCFMLFGVGQKYDTRTLLLLLLSLLIFQLSFFSVGLVISLLVKRVRSVTPYGLGLAFGAYIISAFSAMLGEVKLEYITPFKHFNPMYIVKTGAYDAPLVLLNVAVTIVALVASYWFYTHRDIHAAW